MAPLYICITLKDWEYFLSHYFTWDEVQTIHPTLQYLFHCLVSFSKTGRCGVRASASISLTQIPSSTVPGYLLACDLLRKFYCNLRNASHNTFIKPPLTKYFVLKSQHISEQCICLRVWILWMNLPTQPSTLPRHIPICKLLGLRVMVFLRMFAGNRQLVMRLVEYAVSFHVEWMEHFSDIAHFL